MRIKEKLKQIKDRLKDPFNIEGLEEDFLELESLIKGTSKEELRMIYKDYEEIKKLFRRNVEILKRLYEVK
ncbi:MAG TPA: hypothetical protein EYG91_06500 [Aquifex aeolicus]|nr:hypothetical protein [Aquificota bacterium]HIP43518.1 hypothetical protein [Aquifex aeolicus]